MESEVNVKGVGVKELLKDIFWKSNVPKPKTKIDKAFEKADEYVEKIGRKSTEGETQNRKAKGKNSLKGNVEKIEDVLPAKKKRTSKNLESKLKDDKVQEI